MAAYFAKTNIKSCRYKPIAVKEASFSYKIIRVIPKQMSRPKNQNHAVQPFHSGNMGVFQLENGQNHSHCTLSQKSESHHRSHSQFATPMMLENVRTIWERNGLIDTPTLREGLKFLTTF